MERVNNGNIGENCSQQTATEIIIQKVNINIFIYKMNSENKSYFSLRTIRGGNSVTFAYDCVLR